VRSGRSDDGGGGRGRGGSCEAGVSPQRREAD
jgi:hypothetical protein